MLTQEQPRLLICYIDDLVRNWPFGQINAGVGCEAGYKFIVLWPNLPESKCSMCQTCNGIFKNIYAF